MFHLFIVQPMCIEVEITMALDGNHCAIYDNYNIPKFSN